jgi:hypothetical protein
MSKTMAKQSFRAVAAAEPHYPRPTQLTGKILGDWRPWLVGSLMLGAVAVAPASAQAGENKDAGVPPRVKKMGEMPAPRNIDVDKTKEAKSEKKAKPGTAETKDKPIRTRGRPPAPRLNGGVRLPRDLAPATKQDRPAKPVVSPKKGAAPTTPPAPVKPAKK